MIELSVIIATYNRAQHITPTLCSLLRQSLDSRIWEAVVVNNNSSDDTVAVVEGFALANPQINLRLVTEHRQGLSYARNCGIEQTSGRYIVIIDDDEEANDTFLQTYYDFFESYPEVSVCGGVMTPKYEIPEPRWMSPITASFIASTIDLGRNVREFPSARYPVGGNMGFRRSNFERYGNFNVELGRSGTRLLGGEEKDLINRFRAAGEKVYFLPGAIILHSIPASRLTDDYFNRVTRMIGVSERLRTRAISQRAYFGRLAAEEVKWCAATVLALGYTLKLQPVKGWYLLKMRWNITRGLLGLISAMP